MVEVVDVDQMDAALREVSLLQLFLFYSALAACLDSNSFPKAMLTTLPFKFKHFYDVYRTYGGEQMGPLPELQLVTVRAKQTDFDQTARPAGVPFTRIDPMASSSRD